VLPHGGISEDFSALAWHLPWLPWAFLALWLAIAVEALLGFAGAPDKPHPALRRLLLVLLLPPLRLTINPAVADRVIWLPKQGWQPLGRPLYSQLERRLALPMLLITLLILPVVGAEIFFHDHIANAPALALLLHLVTALIWFAFALEFILLVSVTDRKLEYCKHHWINIVIIVLPLVAFLRTLQFLRFLRLTKASKLARAYRLRGVFARALRLALVLNLIERVLARRPERYIRHLEQKILDKEEELRELRAKLAQARERDAR
jgi:voltage-gated potassium channel